MPGIASLRQIAKDYHEQNGTQIDILDQPPAPLHFSRLVHVSRPVVIKGVDLPALHLWSQEYLIRKMGDQIISVSVTPNGRADAIARAPDNKLYFVEPCVERMSMAEFMSKLSPDGEPSGTGPIYYLQSQNGNVYPSDFFRGEGVNSPAEYKSLRGDVPSEISWCSAALGHPPDAVNLWIGDSRSSTSIHSDPYENVYTVIRGRKHFTLVPPTGGWCLREREYPHAVFARESPGSKLEPIPSSADTPAVRWASITNPHLPGALPSDVHPIHITLSPGDTLYLPAGWWHHVRQSHGITVAVNWWYDMEMRGMSWVLLSFLRIKDVPPGNRPDDEGSSDSDKVITDTII
ncbi:Clavaminate synthase-like protein [Infundibulicybe gibba]|nr:Clavaminate synthase-like protein [Infundibulicybe gibba]